jgi:hypothetical protein
LEAKAVSAVREAGLVSVFETSLGRDLERAQLFHGPTCGLRLEQAAAIWTLTCKQLCERASGDVTALVRPNASLYGTFFRVELPALIKNPEVSRLNGLFLTAAREYLGDRQTFEAPGVLPRFRALLAERAPKVTLSDAALQERIAAEVRRSAEMRSPARDTGRTRDLGL